MLKRINMREGCCSYIKIQQLHFQSKSTSSPTTTTQTASVETSKSTLEWQQAKPFEEMPTMGLMTLMRNFLPGGKYANLDMNQLVLAWKNDYGPLLRMKGAFGRSDTVITHNPQDFEIAYRNEGVWPSRVGTDSLGYHRKVHRADFFQGVEGLLGTTGEQWASFRTVVNPILMNAKNVIAYLPKMSEVNREFIQRIHEIRDKNTLEVPETFEDELKRWTVDSVSVVALDKPLGLISKDRDNADAKRLFHLLEEYFIYSLKVEIIPPIYKYYKTKTFRKYMQILDGITEITHKYVQEAIERIEKQNQNEPKLEVDNGNKSVLEKLINIDKKIGTVMAMDLLMGGIDTTTTTMFGILLCLAKNPKKQEKLREELKRVLPDKDSEIEENTFRQLPYLRACIKESLRIYPIMVGNNRVVNNDVVLSGYRVPKGTPVSMINLSLLNEDDHYRRAKEFLPERWLRSQQLLEMNSGCPEASKTGNPFIYLPFGFGPRSCVGRRIVDMEMELGIARLVRNFYIEFNYPTENAFKSVLINVPNIPLKFKFIDVES